MGTRACPHADDAVLHCAVISDIFGGGSGRYIHAFAKARMIETLSCCETVSVAKGAVLGDRAARERN